MSELKVVEEYIKDSRIETDILECGVDGEKVISDEKKVINETDSTDSAGSTDSQGGIKAGATLVIGDEQLKAIAQNNCVVKQAQPNVDGKKKEEKEQKEHDAE